MGKSSLLAEQIPSGGFVLVLPLQSLLPAQTGLRSVVSSAPSVPLFSFSSTFLRCRCWGGSAVAARGVSKQLALAETQGLNAAGQTLFLTPSGLLGHRQGFVGAVLGVRPHLLPRLLLSHSRSQASPRDWGQIPVEGVREALGFVVALRWGQSHPSSFLFQQKQAAVGKTPQGM